MNTYVDTVVVGAGQAGLATSYQLACLGHQHLVLEQADGPGDAWKNHRWDSFTLNTPNWQSWLPGAEYRGDNPDGFMTRDEIVTYLDNYARRFRLPVRYGTRVSRVERDCEGGGYCIAIEGGDVILAHNVVMATGLHQQPLRALLFHRGSQSDRITTC
jgi:putative flavoprotein involved in K+ transport